MSEFVRYITRQGDRWDLIAWRAYGDVSRQSDLMAANPDIAEEAVFDEGQTLILPIISEAATQDSLLPPWKRGTALAITPVTYLITESAAPNEGPNTQLDYFLNFELTT